MALILQTKYKQKFIYNGSGTDYIQLEDYAGPLNLFEDDSIDILIDGKRPISPFQMITLLKPSTIRNARLVITARSGQRPSVKLEDAGKEYTLKSKVPLKNLLK